MPTCIKVTLSTFVNIGSILLSISGSSYKVLVLTPTHSFILRLCHSPRFLLFRPLMSLRSSSIRNVPMTIWRRLTGTVTQPPSWVVCVAVRSQNRWCPLATRCTYASFLTPQCKGRVSKLHTQQVCGHINILM